VTKLTVAVVAVVAVVAALSVASCSEDSAEPAADCGMPFTEYSAGESVGGHELEARVPTCWKRRSVTYIYGTCHATSDTGCSPPVQVQTWSACHRKPSLGIGPSDIGLSRGETTVVVFATSKRLARTAARALRKAQPPDRSLPATRKLRACGER
jgi:hypothetical protein